MVLRQKVWVDCRVQGVLIGRIILYWALALMYVGLGSACFQYYQHPDRSFGGHASQLFTQIWPWLPSVILFLPLVVFDVVRLSSLFVGPVYRLRNHLIELNDDPGCRPLNFREEDYWQDLVEPVHCLQAEILNLRAEVASLQQALTASKDADAEADSQAVESPDREQEGKTSQAALVTAE
jgi:hypothetical protein